MHTVKKNEIKKRNISFELAYPTLQTQVEFLSDYYFYLLEIGQKEKAILILNQLLEIDPSNENWHDESMRLQI